MFDRSMTCQGWVALLRFDPSLARELQLGEALMASSRCQLENDMRKPGLRRQHIKEEDL